MNKFGDNTQHRNTYIGETLDQLLNEHCSVQSIPKISVEQRNGQWFTSDNRRLWVFRKAEEIGFLKRIYVNISYIKEDKFTTKNGGTSIRVRGRCPGGSLWRIWEPARPPTTTNHVSYDSNIAYSPNRNASYPCNDQNYNASTDADIDFINHYTAQNYHQSHMEYNVRKNNERNVEVPSRFNSNVETTLHAPQPSPFNSYVQTTRPAPQPSPFNSYVETTRPAPQPSLFNSYV